MQWSEEENEALQTKIRQLEKQYEELDMKWRALLEKTKSQSSDV